MRLVASHHTLLLLITLLASVVVASAEPPRVVHVRIQQRLFPLITDFNANGLPESVLIRCEWRDDTGSSLATTTVKLVEPMRASSRHGFMFEGRRYRYVRGGRIQMSGVTPSPRGFERGDRLIGSMQLRYGMYGLVQLPMIDQQTDEELPLSLFNTARGRFALALGNASFDDVADQTARLHFQGAALERAPPMPETIALRRPIGPMP